MAQHLRNDDAKVETLNRNRIYETVSHSVSIGPHVIPNIGDNTTTESPGVTYHNETLAMIIIRMMNVEQRLVLLPTIIFLGFVGSLGAFGNLTVFYIFRFRRQHRSSASFFICVLASVEVIICCVDVPVQILRMVEYFEDQPLPTVMCKISRWFLYSSVSVTCLFVTIIAYDRYVAICRPLQWRTKTSTKIKVAMVTAFVVGTGGQSLQFLFGKESAVPLNEALRQWDYIELGGMNKSAITLRKRVSVCELFFEFSNTFYLLYILTNLVLFLFCVVLSTVFYTLICREMGRRKKFWRLAEAENNQTGSSTSLYLESTKRKTSIQNLPISSRHRTYSVDGLDRHNRNTGIDVTCTSYSNVGYSGTPKRKNAVYMDPTKLEELSQINEQEELSVDAVRTRRFSISTPPGTSEWNQIMNSQGQRRASVAHTESMKVTRKSSEIVPPVVRHKQRTGSVGSISIVSEDGGRRHSSQQCLTPVRRPSVSTIIHKQNFIMAEVFLCVTIILFLSWTPYWILKICSIVIEEFVQSRPKYSASILFFFQNLYYINYVVNPIVYFTLNKRFREDVKIIFLCRKESKATGESKMANIL